ncbi:MAG TPA: ParB N-terminal domain-containing protein [Kineosporiaceae bacterium]
MYDRIEASVHLTDDESIEDPPSHRSAPLQAVPVVGTAARGQTPAVPGGGFPASAPGLQPAGVIPAPAEDIDWVSLDLLHCADSPRLDGLDDHHAQALAASEADLPPILVQRSTMQVIDGAHRVRAAKIRGQRAIQIRYFEGSREEGFIVSVQANVQHGLPLTLADRRSAAQRIIRSWPQASDRWIANIAGLAAKTVAAIRRELGDAMPTARIGRDGRVRPLDTKDRRRIAAELIAADPEASLRKIAKGAGISVGTAQDVRQKVRRGIDPTVTRQYAERPADTDACKRLNRGVVEPLDGRSLLEQLRRDPSLKYSNSGRSLLRWLGSSRLICEADWRDVVSLIPEHRVFDVARIARSCALVWSEFADELDQRDGLGT